MEATAPPRGAETGTGPAPALDERALDRLRRWGGDRLVSDMLVAFHALAVERLSRARAALRAAAPADVGDAAHALRSSSGQLGATRMQALCTRVEQLARAGELDPIGALLDALEEEFERYLRCLPRSTHRLETDP